MPARIILDIRTDSFTHGQLYTTLSRVRTRRDTLSIYGRERRTRLLILYFLIVVVVQCIIEEPTEGCPGPCNVYIK
ncbi:hypothetical protein BDR04DRAFT_675301 [Suillus decipiens]|nr:hypothetical protein BDR04DRAFT_675301 [Suillus decipiens]